jgi:hypothetical protein
MTRQRNIGEFNVVAACSDVYDAQADAVLDLLTRLDAVKRLEDGTKVRFGWSLFTLHRRAQVLEVCEPDFASDPLVRTVPGIDVSLSVVVQQAALLRKIGEEGLDARFDDWLVAAETIDIADELYLFRSPPREADTGWSITDAENPTGATGSGLKGLRVWQLLRIRPDVLPALCLPPSYAAVVRGDSIAAVLDPTGVDRWAT